MIIRRCTILVICAALFGLSNSGDSSSSSEGSGCDSRGILGRSRRLSIEQVSNFLVQKGEGPHWDERTKTLLYVDQAHGLVTRLNPRTKINVQNYTFGDSNVTLGAIPYKSNKNWLLVAINAGLYKVDARTGKILQTLTTVTNMKNGTTIRINDLKCDKKGRVIFGTMPLVPWVDDTFPAGLGTLYSYEEGASQAKVLREGVGLSNGITWSNDGKTLYFVDTYPGRYILAFDYNMNTGSVSNERVHFDIHNHPQLDKCGPDGLTTDTMGRVWLACFGAASVVEVDPVMKDKFYSQIAIPAYNSSSLCFGGHDYEDMFVTTFKGGSEVSDAEKAQYPNGGAIFKVNIPGVRGSKANEFGK